MFSGIPQDFAISLLKKSAKIPLLKNIVNNINTIVIITLIIISLADEINKFPQKRLKTSVKCSLNKLAKIKAMAILKENNSPTDMLSFVFDFFERGFIIIAANIENTKPEIIGFIPINSPITAPAKAQCAMVTPINGIFNNNIHTPIIPQDTPAKIDNISALLKKEYLKKSKNSNIIIILQLIV
jgi:hypothetical protein